MLCITWATQAKQCKLHMPSGCLQNDCSSLQVFDFSKWKAHRSPWKYFTDVASLPLSHTLRSISFPLLWVIIVTALIGLNMDMGKRGLLPWWLCLPPAPSGSALSGIFNLKANWLDSKQGNISCGTLS